MTIIYIRAIDLVACYPSTKAMFYNLANLDMLGRWFVRLVYAFQTLVLDTEFVLDQ